METNRPNPEVLLAKLVLEEVKSRRGNLRLFFGMAAGVGKTYQMLKEAHERIKEGVDVWIGFVETHGRTETQALVNGIPIIPRKKIEYKETFQEEMDLDAILRKRPQLVLIDELAHTNVPGSRHEKRYQDILEVLDAGIDVYSTMNVQHLESRADIVTLITSAKVRETVPDTVLDMVDRIELIDITPEGLIERLKEGKVYPGRKTEQALQNFFQEGNLSALREMSLRVTANKIERDMKDVVNTGRKEKLLVAVSHSPFSEKLIRTARRIVEELEIGWVAVHVDTGKLLNPTDHNQLIKNLELARELGAETVTLHGTDIAETIGNYVSENKVVQIIIGRPVLKPKWWKKNPKVIEKLIEQNPTVDITVLQQATANNIEIKKPNTKLFIHWSDITKAVSCIILTAIINYFLNPYIGYRAVGFLFLLMIVVLGISFPIFTILVAAILSGLVWNFFFIPPKWTLTIGAPEDIMMFIAYIVIALTCGFLTSKIKQNQKTLRDREEKTRALYEILKSMSLVTDLRSILEFSLKKIEEQFNASCSIFIPEDGIFPNKPSFGKLEINEKEKAVVLWSYNNGKNAGWSTDTLPMSAIASIPLRSANEKYGVLVFKPNGSKKLTPDQENLLLGMVGQIGIVLAKQKYDEKNKQTTLLHESEKLHKTILNCISHELRTPLTAIMGATSVLNSQIKNENENVKSLCNEIMQASEKLNQIFANLLDVTRIEGGAVKLNSEWFDSSELIESVISKRKKIFYNHQIKFNFPPYPIYLFGDFELLEHAIANILINVVGHTPGNSTVTISLSEANDKIIINFADNGPGIPEKFISEIFEKFYRVPGTKTGGLGLGLSITKSIVEIHGGKIEARNNADGGATFSIVLPYQKPPKQLAD